MARYGYGQTYATLAMLLAAMPLAPSVRVASFQNHIPNAQGAITFTNYASRKIDVLPKAQRSLQYEFNNWYISPGSTSLASDNTNALYLTSVYISCNGVVVQALFGGSPTRTIAAGEDMVRHDALNATQFGFPTDIFPEGTIVNATAAYSQPTTGHKFLYTAGLSSTAGYGGGGSQSYTWNPASTTMVLNNVGLMTWTGTAPSAAAGGIGMVPILVGIPVENDVQALVVRGNSQSQNETSWIQQAALSLNWPLLNLAVSSSKIQAGLDDPRVKRMYALGNQGIIQFGRNEFPAMSVAQLKTYVAQDAAAMRSKGITRIGCDDVPPYTSSTDSWTTALNQSQQAGSGSGSNDDLFSQQIMTISGIDYKTTRNSNRDAGDFFKWLTNGTASYPTLDGKHSSVALETLKAAENVPKIGTAAQIAKANAEISVLNAEMTMLLADMNTAQALINTASAAGANVTRMQARIDAIIVIMPTFVDAMGAAYAANSDVPSVNAGWTALPSYTTNSLQYIGTANGIKLVAAGAGAIRPTTKVGNSVQQIINFTGKAATGANGAICVLMLDEQNWIGITAFGQSAFTLTRVSICQAGTVTTLADFTNFANATSSDVFKMQIRNIAGVYTVELWQNTHQLSVSSGSANVTTYVDPAGSGFLKAARYPGLVWRGAAQSTWLSLWSNTAFNTGVFSLANVSVSHNEGDSGTVGYTYTITRKYNTVGPATVDWSVAGSSGNPANSGDFSATSGTVAFADGDVSKTFTVNVLGDLGVEPDEQFTVTIANPSVGVLSAAISATGTIINEDSAFSISPSTVTHNEGNSGSTAYTFTVTRSGYLLNTSAVDYTVTGSGANPATGVDMVGGLLQSGTIPFVPADASQDIVIYVAGNTTNQPDRQFTVTLSNPLIGTITSASADGIIIDDDAPVLTVPDTPIVTLTAGNGQISVAWSDGYDGGSAILTHTVIINGTPQTPISSAPPYVITGLPNGTPVAVQVLATNAIGDSAPSPSQSDTPFVASSITFTGSASPASWGMPYAGGTLTETGGTSPFSFLNLPGGMTGGTSGTTVTPGGTPA